MTGLLVSWRVAVAAALLAGALFVVYTIRKNGELVAELKQQRDAVQVLEQRATRLEAITTANDQHDAQVRAQQQTVRVVVDDARRSDPDAAALLDARLPDALRRRVFANDDPTGGSAETEQPARP